MIAWKIKIFICYGFRLCWWVSMNACFAQTLLYISIYLFMYNIFYDRIIIARTTIICFFVSCWLLKSNTKRGTVTAPRSPRIYSNRIEVLKLWTGNKVEEICCFTKLLNCILNLHFRLHSTICILTLRINYQTAAVLALMNLINRSNCRHFSFVDGGIILKGATRNEHHCFRTNFH